MKSVSGMVGNSTSGFYDVEIIFAELTGRPLGVVLRWSSPPPPYPDMPGGVIIKREEEVFK